MAEDALFDCEEALAHGVNAATCPDKEAGGVYGLPVGGSEGRNGGGRHMTKEARTGS